MPKQRTRGRQESQPRWLL